MTSTRLDRLFCALTDIIENADERRQEELYEAFKALRENAGYSLRQAARKSPIAASLFEAIDAGTKWQAAADQMAEDA